MQSLLQAVGVGARRSLPAAATINWVLKDGLGRLGRLTVATRFGESFDSDLKVGMYVGGVGWGGGGGGLAGWLAGWVSRRMGVQGRQGRGGQYFCAFPVPPAVVLTPPSHACCYDPFVLCAALPLHHQHHLCSQPQVGATTSEPVPVPS